MAYQQLSTEKYWNEKARQEVKAIRKQQGRDAMAAFRNFLFCLVIIAGTFWAYTTMPEWLPQAAAFVENSGVIERFFSGLQKVQALIGYDQLANVTT